MTRKLSSGTAAAAAQLLPNLGWFLSPNQMDRLNALLSEDNPQAKAAGHELFCAVHDILDKFDPQTY